MSIQKTKSPLQSPSNRELLQDYVASQNAASFQALVTRFGPMVLGVARRLLSHHEDAEDAMQLTFADLARRAGTVERPESIGSWLHTVTYQNALKLRKRRPGYEPLASDPVDPRLSLDGISRRSDLEVLSEELDRLPATWREPLVLRYLAGLSNEETARQLETTVTAIEGRLKRGKMSLRVRLLRRGVSLSAVAAAVAPAQFAEAGGIVAEADYWLAVGDSSLDLSADQIAFDLLPSAAGPIAQTGAITSKGLVAVAAAAVIMVLLAGEGHALVPKRTTVGLSTVTNEESLQHEPFANLQIVSARPDQKSEQVGETYDRANQVKRQHYYSHWDVRYNDEDELLTSSPDPGYFDPFEIGMSLKPAVAGADRNTMVEGFVVENVAPGSPAEKSGIQVGDVVLAWQNHRLLGNSENAVFSRDKTAEKALSIWLRKVRFGRGFKAWQTELEVIRNQSGEVAKVEIRGGAPTKFFPSVNYAPQQKDASTELDVEKITPRETSNHYFRHWESPPERDESTPDPAIADPFQIGVSIVEADLSQVPAYFPSAFRIERVIEGSPAERAGLEVGDLLLRRGRDLFYGTSVDSPYRYSGPRNRLISELAKAERPNSTMRADFDVLDHRSQEVVRVSVGSQTKASKTQQVTKATRVRLQQRRKLERSIDAPAFQARPPSSLGTKQNAPSPETTATDNVQRSHYFKHWGSNRGDQILEETGIKPSPDPSFNDPFQLGMSLKQASKQHIPAFFPNGFEVEKVAAGSPADVSGIEVGDIVLAWNEMRFPRNLPVDILSGDQRSEIVLGLQSWLGQVTPLGGLGSWGTRFDVRDRLSGEVVKVGVAFGDTAGLSPNDKARQLRKILDRKRERSGDRSSRQWTAEDRSVAETLAQPTLFKVSWLTLNESMEKIAEEIGVDIVLDDIAVESLGIPATKKLPHSNLGRVWCYSDLLAGLLYNADPRLTYTIENGKVIVTTVGGAIHSR